MELTLFFAVCAGVGAGAAWGYRTALYVALGKEGRLGSIGNPRPPRPDNRSLPVPIPTAREREEMTR